MFRYITLTRTRCRDVCRVHNVWYDLIWATDYTMTVTKRTLLAALAAGINVIHYKLPPLQRTRNNKKKRPIMLIMHVSCNTLIQNRPSWLSASPKTNNAAIFRSIYLVFTFETDWAHYIFTLDTVLQPRIWQGWKPNSSSNFLKP